MGQPAAQPAAQPQSYGEPQPGFSATSPYAPAPPQQQQPMYGQNQSPYGQPVQQPVQQPVNPAQAPFPGAPAYPPQQQQQPPQQPPVHQNPYGGASPYAPATTESAVVVSQNQTNPYASLVNPGLAAPPAPYYGDSQSVISASTNATGNPFDPFATAPPPAPVPPAPVPEPAYYQQQQQQQQPPTMPPQQTPPQPDVLDNSNPFGDFLPPAAPEPPKEPVSHAAREPPVPLQNQSHENNHRTAPSATSPTSPRNKYANEIARQAPVGASPLPKAELVHKKGYVLARISFRTIVIKKWKQAFWVQYGPHTMLWFRSESDFDDWLNNPYHNQQQRNFLIKLAVNFVHDLYKPNVRGYQVTQCRTKAYGSKMVRQFKLERWMDYGPTIAAAFGAYNPKEVDDLREALVECMRNTPLSGGIRATGAVRRQPQQSDHRDGGEWSE